MENYKEFDYLKPLHKKHLEMLKDLDVFFSKYNIEWSLAYGSVLGAVRHNGTIPWDDDVDIMMTVDNYEKFRSIFHMEGNKEKYYLQELGVVNNMIDFAKIRMNNTTFVEDIFSKFDMHHGIFIDIFILHNAPLKKSQLLYGNFLSKFCHLKFLSNRHYNKRKWLLPFMWFLRLFPSKFAVKTPMKYRYKFDSINSNSKIIWGLDSIVLDNEILFPFKKINYDGLNLPVPNNCDKYLTLHYGDWKKIPSIDSIKWAHHSNNWDVDRDFRHKLNGIKNFSDENII